MYTFVVVIISLVVGFVLGGMLSLPDEEEPTEVASEVQMPKATATGASSRILTGKMRIPLTNPPEG